MLALKEFRSNIRGLADLLNWAAIPAPGILLSKDGSLTTGFYFRGPDMQSSTHEEMSVVSAQINAGLARMGTGWMLHVDCLRVPSVTYPEASRSFFRDPTSFVIDDERRVQYQSEGAHFETVYAMALTYLVPPQIHGKIAEVFIDDDTVDKTKRRGMDLEVLLNKYKSSVEEIIGTLQSRLQVRQMDDNELCTYLHTCLTGEMHDVKAPPFGMYLDSVLASKPLRTGISPRIGDKHIRVVSINGFPSESTPGILDALGGLPIQYRWSTRFIALDQLDAEKRLSVYRRNWFQKRHGLMGLVKAAMGGGEQTWQNSDAVRMAQDADAAVNENAEGLVRFGYYTSCIVIMHDDPIKANDEAKAVVKVLGNMGFPSSIEDINAVEAFLGTLPSHGFPNVRRAPMHTLNLSDLLPLTSVWAGSETHPCPYYPKNSPPMMYAATTGSTPFRFSTHYGDVGHTLIVGGSGGGKSTLLNLMTFQMRRYGSRSGQNVAQTFTFDKGYSAVAVTKASGGAHYDICGEGSELAFCPLGRIDESAAERSWAKEFVEMLVLLQLPPGSSLTPPQRESIHHAIELLAKNTTNSAQRTITDLKSQIQDRALKEALNYYTIDGALGPLLDSTHDGLANNPYLCFECEHLMERGDKTLVPVLMYLFRQIEKRLSVSRPSLIIIDEFGALLSYPNPLFRDYVTRFLRVARKENTAVYLATQNLTDITESEIANVVLTNVATKILLPNHEAMTDNMRPHYRALGLNDRQIENLAYATPKRDYYFMNGYGRRMITFGIAPGSVTMAFVGAAGKEAKARIERLETMYGTDWPLHWMKERGVSDVWCDYWKKVKQEMNHA